MHKLFLLTVFLPLIACGAVTHGPTQEITIRTPGAENARCDVYNEDYRYSMATNETRNIMRSRHPLTVECMASNNRTVKVVVTEEVTDAASYGNITTLGLGAAYDYFDGSMYEYPSEIVVNFVGVNPDGYDLPAAYNDGQDPASHAIESYSASEPVLEVDKDNQEPVLLKKKDITYGQSIMGESAAPSIIPAPLPPVSGSGSYIPAPLPSVGSGLDADDLTRSMNPHVFQ